MLPIKLSDGSQLLINGGIGGFRRVPSFTPGSGGGGGGSSSGHIGDPIILAQRNARAAAHGIGGAETEGNFTGFTDTTGWNVLTATSADGLRTALLSVGINDTTIIECQWNGESVMSNTSVNGISEAALTPNAGVDWGFDRAGQKIMIRPATGYSPILGSSAGVIDANAIQFRGFNYVHATGIEFAQEVEFFTNPGYTPTIAIAAFTNCTIRGKIRMSTIRTMHIENCWFGQDSGPGNGVGTVGTAQYHRVWNCNLHRATKDIDVFPVFGVTGAWASNWTTNVWLAGNFLWNMDDTVVSGNHSDVFQYATAGDTHQGYSLISEFNVMVANGLSCQNHYGDDASSTNYVRTDYVNHNNILINNAAWSANLFDQSGAGDLSGYRLLCCRGTSISADTSIIIGYHNIDSTGSLPAASDNGGSFRIRECYVTSIVQNGGGPVVADVTIDSNIVLNPRVSASTSEKMDTLLTGNGTWAVDGNGWNVYTPPDAVNDRDTAWNAVINFYKPKVGWNDGTGCGPTDPDTWPTVFGGPLS